ncbi:hypothetical protein [Nostoc sp. MG11]|uniref:hypothetical protein n=1 Tax=Nostoc sp. MG11 TaxID=2721166 RepID=UPI001868BD75|nr:hypothetical protein [Nostoc sp. MG11]
MLWNVLQAIRRQITQKLGLSSSKSNTDANTAPISNSQLEFLLQVLKATADSNSDAKVIHPLLEANREKLDMNFAQVLRSWAMATLSDLEIDTARNTVGNIINFSNLMQDFPLGNRRNNLEIAITGYEIALTVFTQDRFPIDWATTQNNLGEAYRNRIQGERASSEHDPQDQKALKNLADECLQAFFPNSYPIPPFTRSATLFGSPIFEYGLFNQLTNYRHVLVWFFSHREAEEKFNDYQEQLLDLFFFRAKAVKAFQKSREVYEDTNKEYQKIEAEINNFKQIDDTQLLNNEKLDKLSGKLKTLPQIALDYANFLRYLESYQNTIAINGRNYTDRLQQIRGIVKDEDISFLEKFSLENSPDFQEQIKAELGYFTHGSSLLDKAIVSIQGRVEIDRAKSDRNLQITILAVGIGIGAGGIMASSYSLVQDDPILKVLHTPVTNRFTAAITYSLLFGFAIGILIWGCDKLWQSHKRKRQQ